MPLAAVLEHDTNNLIGKLYAAADWLGDKPDADALVEGQLAVADALGAAFALQAVFHLLAFDANPPAPQPPDAPQKLARSTQSRLFARLKEAAGVQVPAPDERFASALVDAGVDTLSAVLVCAARLLRRRVGSGPTISLALQQLPSGGLQMSLTASPARAPDPREADRPEAQALAGARAQLDALGLSWREPLEADDGWQLMLMAKGVQP